MVSTVNIGGHKINKWWLVGGAGGVVAVWYLYKRSASGAGSANSADSSSTDPLTGLPYSEDNQVDPETGLTYLAEAQEYGSVAAAEAMVTSGSAFFGDTGAGNALDSGFPTLDGSGSGDTGTSGGSFTTNSAWAQAVTAGLVQLGYSSQDVAAALGLFFARHPLGSGADGVSYATIIQAAEAEFGPPPVGSYQIIPEPSHGGGGTGGTKVKVPSVTGLGLNAAHTKLQSAGLSFNADNAKDKKGYERKVTAEKPSAGSSVAKGTHIDLTWKYVKT